MPGSSGQFGLAQIAGTPGQNLVECTGWSMSKEAADHAYATCATGGYKRRITGTKDATGDVKGVLDPNAEIEAQIDVGFYVTYWLYITPSKYYTVPAAVLSLDIEVDIEEGDVIRWTSGYGLNGAWTNGGGFNPGLEPPIAEEKIPV